MLVDLSPHMFLSWVRNSIRLIIPFPSLPSSHVWTGLAGLGLLGVQSLLPLTFASGTGEARTAVSELLLAVRKA